MRGSSTTCSLAHFCLAQKSSHLIAQCHSLHLTWALHRHLARALLPWHDLPHFPRILFSVSFNPAPIYVNLSVVHWRNPHPSQVTSPRIISSSPKTSISLSTRILPNMRIYVSNRHSSIDRAQLRPTILRRASRHLFADSDLDDDQIRAPLYLQEREANGERSQVYHSVKENLMSSSSQDPIRPGKPVALLVSSKNRLNPETFSDREVFSLRHQHVLGKNEPVLRFSYTETPVKTILEGHRDDMLAEAKSEIMKQECKVDPLNTCISELQQQTYAQRLELEDAHFGYAESRREQVRLEEELALIERALWNSRIRNIHEMEDLRTAKEMRVDEISAQNWESHATTQELASQIQDLQERVKSRSLGKCGQPWPRKLQVPEFWSFFLKCVVKIWSMNICDWNLKRTQEGPGIAVLVSCLGHLSFGAQGWLQKPDVRDKGPTLRFRR